MFLYTYEHQFDGMYIHVLYWLGSSRGQELEGSIPDRVRPKALNIVLVVSLLDA